MDKIDITQREVGNLTKKGIVRWLAAVVVLCLGLSGMGVKPASAALISDSALIHKVAPGENLWSIAVRYGVSVHTIVSLNELLNPDRLRIGQRLIVKESNDGLSDESSDGSGEETAINQRDIGLLAKIIYAEARGENFEGQVAVGAVVLNRLRHPGFPKTLAGVIYQPGAFTAINDNQIQLIPDVTAREAAKAAINGDDPTHGALFYYNPSIAKDPWIRTRPVVKVIGNHTFSI